MSLNVARGKTAAELAEERETGCKTSGQTGDIVPSVYKVTVFIEIARRSSPIKKKEKWFVRYQRFCPASRKLLLNRLRGTFNCERIRGSGNAEEFRATRMGWLRLSRNRWSIGKKIARLNRRYILFAISAERFSLINLCNRNAGGTYSRFFVVAGIVGRFRVILFDMDYRNSSMYRIESDDSAVESVFLYLLISVNFSGLDDVLLSYWRIYSVLGFL